MRARLILLTLALTLAFMGVQSASAWDPLPVDSDPLLRMPGTQPDGALEFEPPSNCECHFNYHPSVEPGRNWAGSLMSQAGRDFLFWASIVVAGQDSIWALGNPNAVDLCERCHFPVGWLGDRSDPTNASLMVGADFDGVQCDVCHRMWDPFFETTYTGAREGSDWIGYWDETGASVTPSQTAADQTYALDQALALELAYFNGEPLFTANVPTAAGYTENGAGQLFVSPDITRRAASFADAYTGDHAVTYSRYHKSRNFCGACHDVSNPALANLGQDGTAPLTTETQPAYAYYHAERTFSEFALSAYGQQGGAEGIGSFAPATFNTSVADDSISRCQDCHMRDGIGRGSVRTAAPTRPGTVEHPESGVPIHDLTGGGAWVSLVLASAVPSSSNYDPINEALLNQGPAVLTLDLTQGEGVDPAALLSGAERAMQQLRMAASIEDLTYDSTTGALAFRVQNQTGHKLLTGYPEGRRMFVNVRAYDGQDLIYEVNPYDYTVGTLKSMPDSPVLGPNEASDDRLVYEMHGSSTITGEQETFHFVLTDGRYKDNRIPPKGFRIADAAERVAEPVWEGVSSPSYFSAEEYAGGYDDVTVTVPAGATAVQVSLYYQSTSREYVEFLRDEINGTAGTLTGTGAGGDPAYIVQSDPFFGGLKAWGDTIWQLWQHNKDLPGAAPILMSQATTGPAPVCGAPVPEVQAAVGGPQQVILTWSDLHSADPQVLGYTIYYDQGGKLLLLAEVGRTSSYTDTGLLDDTVYVYRVAARYSGCESTTSEPALARTTRPADLFYLPLVKMVQ